MNFALNMMKFVFKMMNYVLEMSRTEVSWGITRGWRQRRVMLKGASMTLRLASTSASRDSNVIASFIEFLSDITS